ncbi:ATP-binding protein [Nodularia spumigena]|uniref:ATP-binding protein n=1 Tax=Nodularia spumigena TaxID=70799 RepID=UPI002B20820A|nr:ATP-binding protein [Nodularia spumigena]MEA5612280.1 ATP-binding protein [Nodularia spumigena UHCC 0040]
MTGNDTAIPGAIRVELRRDRAEIDALIERVLHDAKVSGFPDGSVFGIRLALEEAITNAFEHGHEHLADATVRVDYVVNQTAVDVAVEDKGPGFNPDALPDPTAEENISKPSGRGVMLMRAYMTEVRFNPSGNRVRLTYRRPR